MQNPGSPSPRDTRRTARAEAAAWIVRLHGPHRSAELEAGFRQWLAADPENARQFERVTEVWDAGATSPVAGLPRVTRWREAQGSRRWALAASVLFVFALGTWGFNQFWLGQSYATRLGEQRLVRLDDGSRIALNSNTRIRVSCCENERRIHLERGEAYFEVARDAARPFVVDAGGHRVTALGTAFVVRHDATRTAVTLVEGKVAVSGAGKVEPIASPALYGSAGEGARESVSGGQDLSAPRAPGATTRLQTADASIVLSPGQRVTFAGSAKPWLDEPRIEAVTAWRRGEVMLDRTTLADAIAEMNRYDEQLLVVDDPIVAALRISGIYHAGDSAGFARTVAKLYGLEVVQQAGRIQLIQSPPGTRAGTKAAPATSASGSQD